MCPICGHWHCFIFLHTPGRGVDKGNFNMLIDFATTEINFVICCTIHTVHVVVQFYPWFEYFVCLVCV